MGIVISYLQGDRASHEFASDLPQRCIDAADRSRRYVAKLLRDGGYSYGQSKYLIAEARRRVGLPPPSTQER